MILINKNEENIFSIYKSSFNYSNDYNTTAGYTLNFKNDISLLSVSTDLISVVDNEAYTSIYINDKGLSSTSFNSSSGELILPLNGLYTLTILNINNEVVYKERVFVKDTKNFIEDDYKDITTYTNDDGFTKYTNE